MLYFYIFNHFADLGKMVAFYRQISQWPVLSEPTLLIIFWFFKLLSTLVTVLLLILDVATICSIFILLSFFNNSYTFISFSDSFTVPFTVLFTVSFTVPFTPTSPPFSTTLLVAFTKLNAYFIVTFIAEPLKSNASLPYTPTLPCILYKAPQSVPYESYLAQICHFPTYLWLQTRLLIILLISLEKDLA